MTLQEYKKGRRGATYELPNGVRIYEDEGYADDDHRVSYSLSVGGSWISALFDSMEAAKAAVPHLNKVEELWKTLNPNRPKGIHLLTLQDINESL